MKITYFGTTMLLFDDGRDQVLFDCHVTRPSIGTCLVGYLSTDTVVADKVISQFGFDRLRAIFISHSHHDHVLDASYFANQCGADIFGSESALNVARGGKVLKEHLYSFRENTSFQIGKYQVTILPSIHSKAHWYNNDLGKTITQPLAQPTKKKDFKEGGSFDFLISHQDKTFLIRPSYNYLEGQFDTIQADVLFLGISGLSKDSDERKKKFFYETINKVRPHTVIPVHWDNFFSPLYSEIRTLPKLMDNTSESMRLLAEYCFSKNITCIVQLPLTSIEL